MCINDKDNPWERASTFINVKVNQICIHCLANCKWEFEVLFDYFKGNHKNDKLQHKEKSTGLATSHVQNLQFKLAASVIPFLLWRKPIAVVQSDGSLGLPLGTLEDFLAAEEKKETTYSGIGDDFLFVKGTSGGQAKDLVYGNGSPVNWRMSGSWV